MSYRCHLCGKVRPHGQPRLIHLVKRPSGQILQELAVCADHKAMLDAGIPLSVLQRQCSPKEKTSEAPKPIHQPTTYTPSCLSIPVK